MPKQPQPAGPPEIRVIGAARPRFGDFYHAFLRLPWSAALGCIVAVYLLANAGFALVYMAIGGVTGARLHSFADAFFFSVQTMGTIGYGAMYPTTMAANCIVVAESVTSLVITAVSTGLLFAKFSQSQARIVFTKQIAIGPMDGVPTLMIRLGNQRSNRIIEAQIRLVMIRTEKTREGATFYRMYDLVLTRDRSPAMQRSWTALHRIDAKSPLYGATPESVKKDEVEVLVTVFGVDDTSLQPVHAQKRYSDDEIVWGARHADILREEADGSLTLDLRKFDDVEPTEATPDFPYPRDKQAA
jgi:inward rectifier potassium channel